MNNTSSTVRLCVERLCAGESSARAELIEACMNRFRLLASRMLRGYPTVKQFEQSDDILQNAMIRLDRTLQEISISSKEDVYRLGATMIRRELIDLARHYGSKGRKLTLATGGEMDSKKNYPEPSACSLDSPDLLESWAEFHEQIDRLPEADRQLFDLLWYQGLTQQEAADFLSIPLRTLKRSWQAAKLKLADKLGGSLPF